MNRLSFLKRLAGAGAVTVVAPAAALEAWHKAFDDSLVTYGDPGLAVKIADSLPSSATASSYQELLREIYLPAVQAQLNQSLVIMRELEAGGFGKSQPSSKT